ncbi:MAG TPA: hypothetical protein VG457_10025, partial [Planctomycetota bacterium]|nr:hypothetical protein [Planctomycetota bacterium]
LNDRYREAWVTVSESFALGPVASNLLLKGVLATRWLGDVKMAEALVAQLPASGVDEDRYASLAVEVHWMKRDPEKLLATINAFPGDWLSSNSFDGPKAYYGGWAYQMAGRPDAAMSEWRRALEQTDERLKEAPNSVSLLTMKGELLVRMGSGERRAEAEEAFRLADQFAGRSGPGLTEALMLGENDTAIRLLANANTLAAFLRLNPTYDPLRGDAQFVALLKRAEADPRLSPTAEEMAAAGATRAAEAE